jgi:hypothetical protein
MTRRLLAATFEHEDDVLAATDAVRRRGLTIVDVHAPYAVHGLDRAMGLEPSKLPWVCFLLGLAGAAFKVWFEYWTTASAWPINVGGKPWNSLPAFVPVTFEVMVLFAGLSTVAAFFLVDGLRPGRRAELPDPRVTDDHFVLLLEQTDASFDVDDVRALLLWHNAVEVDERVERIPSREVA